MHLGNDKYLQGLPPIVSALAVDTTTAQRCELHDDRTASRMIYELFLAMQVKFERSFTGAGGWLACHVKPSNFLHRATQSLCSVCLCKRWVCFFPKVSPGRRAMLPSALRGSSQAFLFRSTSFLIILHVQAPSVDELAFSRPRVRRHTVGQRCFRLATLAPLMVYGQRRSRREAGRTSLFCCV